MRFDDPHVHDAVRVIHDHPRTNPYARAYTAAYLENAHGIGQSPVQILYILNNITRLRDFPGESRGRNARETLKGVHVHVKP